MKNFMFCMMLIVAVFMLESAQAIPDDHIFDDVDIVHVDHMDQSTTTAMDHMDDIHKPVPMDGTSVDPITMDPKLINEPIQGKENHHDDVGWYDAPVPNIEQPPSQRNRNHGSSGGNPGWCCI